MKKIIFIIVMLCFFSGCTVDYYLNIDEFNDHTFSEDVDLNAETLAEQDNINSYQFPVNAYYNDPYISEEPTYIEEIEYYKVNKFDNGNIMNLKYTYPSSRFLEGEVAKMCYKITRTEKEDVITYATNGTNFCFDYYRSITQINIYISVKGTVENQNADEVIGNKYIWKIDRNNYNSKRILISYSETKKEIVEEEKERPNFWIILGTFSLFLIGLGTLLIYNVKKQNENT